MTAQELRIGNLVYDSDNDVMAISEISDVWVSFKGSNIKNFNSSIKPIPLTEKLLNKCEFKFKELGFENLSVSYGTTSKEIHFVIGSHYVRLNFVHELQNLYFALTKHELTIKL